MILAFLNVLERISFDETLFKKEFIKTLGWVSKDDFPAIQEWMHNHRVSEKYPELEELLLKFKFVSR